MNLNMLRPKNQTKNLFLSITKNGEILIHQTQTKPQETLEFKLTKPRETFFSVHLLILVLNLIGWLV